MTAPRVQLADELLRRFAAALRSAQLYSKGHPIIARNLESLSAAIQLLHTLAPTRRHRHRRRRNRSWTTCRWRRRTRIGPLIQRLRQIGVERITIDRGVTLGRAQPRSSTPSTALEHQDAGDEPEAAFAGTAAHPRRPRHGRASDVDGELGRHGDDQADVQRGRVGRRATSGTARRPRASPTPPWRKTMIDGLAQAVAQNRIGAPGADDAQELRQLHVHAHGERVDPDDGPGARPRHRRRRCCASSASPR